MSDNLRKNSSGSGNTYAPWLKRIALLVLLSLLLIGAVITTRNALRSHRESAQAAEISAIITTATRLPPDGDEAAGPTSELGIGKLLPGISGEAFSLFLSPRSGALSRKN
jgi:hypothetical protein